MLRVAMLVVALTLFVDGTRLPAGRVAIATPAQAADMGDGWRGGLEFDFLRRLFVAWPSLGDIQSPATVDGCALPLLCRNPFRGLARVTRRVTSTTQRVLGGSTRATVRLARRTASTTARIAGRAARVTAGVTAGVATGAAGLATGALSLALPRRKRSHAEFAVTSLRRADAERLSQRGYFIIQTRDSPLLGKSVTRVRAPDGKSASLAQLEIIDTAPDSGVARNDLFRRPTPGLYRPAGRHCDKRCETFDVTSWTSSMRACSAGARIGVVDTGVDLSHSSLRNAKVVAHTTRSLDLPPSDKDHGTGVVSLLVGQPGSAVAGLVPDAQVFAADAFHGEGGASGADVFDLIAALDWLAEEKVSVVNLSLSGPDNSLLREAIDRLIARNIAVVAASGQLAKSDADVGYPAKYDGVIAVSAIDNRLRPSRVALRGDHISFTAPGVGVEVAQGQDRVRKVEGTSFASPFVAAAYAIGATPTSKVAEVTAHLVQSAKDLGAPGRDPIFGWGLLQFSGLGKCMQR